jgi:putative membrane protein
MTHILFFLALFAQAGPPSPQPPSTENRAPVPAKPAPLKEPTFATVDRMFAIVLTQANNAEVDMANVALKQASANEVIGYAGKMISEHEGLMKEFQPVIGRFLGSEPPGRLAGADVLAMQHLQALKPPDFDQEYVLGQIGAHLASMTVFEAEAQNGTDPDLNALARKWLPKIKTHLELAVDLTQHVGGASPFKSH